MEFLNLFFIQLIGCIGFGSFIGEFYRTTVSNSFDLKLFIANFLAGGFLSFLIAYIFYLISNQREITLLFGSLIAYQDEKFISRISKILIQDFLRNGGDKRNGQH